MIDPAILRPLLKVLHLLGKNSLRVEVLMDEVAINCAFRPTAGQINEHIRFAEDQGFIESSSGMLQEKRYKITDKGEAAYREGNQ